MSQAGTSPLESRHCPVCEYDLQGNASGRCPECGTSTGAAAFSRLPWIYRQARGGIRAYGQMLAILLFRPWNLLSETNRRVLRQPPARFHHESIALATFIAAGFLTVGFMMRGPHWDALLGTPLTALLASGHAHLLLILPLLVWNDQLLMLMPLIPALYIALYATAWMYRRMLQSANGESAASRRRIARMGFYASGLAPILAILLGGLFIVAMIIYEQMDVLIGGWGPVVRILLPVLTMLALLVFCYPTAVLLFKGKKRRIMRAFIALLLFPVLQVAAWGAIGFMIFWIFGYVALVTWSMTH